MAALTNLRFVLACLALLAGASMFLAPACLQAEPPSAGPASAPAGAIGAEAAVGEHLFWHVLLALASVIVCGRLLGKLLSYLGQPPVIGEVAAGILLGPSLLGERISHLILPPAAAPHLQTLAQLGVVLYMFLVGLELDAGRLRGKMRATVAITVAGAVVPFLLGAALAVYLYPLFAPRDVAFSVFLLFVGVSLSVTAFPVLARILADRNLSQTPLGALSLSSAALGDAAAWCLLALVVGIAHGTPEKGALVAALTAGYILFMFLVVAPLAARLLERRGERPLTPGMAAAALVGALLSALATEAIGIHALFGAFLAGAIIPRESALARELTARLATPVSVLLLPAFFAISGMRTELSLISGGAAWLACGLIILAATAGKFGGTLIAARCSGLSWQESAAIGTLMNTRGLMELIVLNIGLELGVISPALFAMFVLMALATTAATTPVLDLVWRAKAAGPNES